jgi:hypothetical protein
MRIAAYAALLAVAHGTALAGDRDQVRGPGWSGRATDTSRSLDARAAEALAWTKTREAQQRGCGCSAAVDRSNGHADAAGF